MKLPLDIEICAAGPAAAEDDATVCRCKAAVADTVPVCTQTPNAGEGP